MRDVRTDASAIRAKLLEKLLKEEEAVSTHIRVHHAARFWRVLISHQVNDDRELSAAVLLSRAGIIEAPKPALSKKIEDYLGERWNSEQSAFAFFLSVGEDLENRCFDKVKLHPFLLVVACELFNVFKVAPKAPTMPGYTSLCELRGHYLIPIFERVFPQYSNLYLYTYFEDWLELDGVLTPAEMLESASAWMRLKVLHKEALLIQGV